MAVAIALADDSVIVREGVARVLAAQPDMEVVVSCGDLPSLMEAVASERPDVVVTDIRMPPTSTDEGIRAAVLLREQHPDIGVVVLSNYAEPAYAMALLESGSEGRAYLLKERIHDRAQLVAAIESVAAGGSVVDCKIVEPLVTARGYVQRRRTSCRCQRSSVCGRDEQAVAAHRRQQPGCAGKQRPVTRPSAGRPT